MLLRLLSLNKPVIIRAGREFSKKSEAGSSQRCPSQGCLCLSSPFLASGCDRTPVAGTEVATALPCAALLLLYTTITSCSLCTGSLGSEFYIVNMGTLSKQMLVRRCLQKGGSQTSCTGDSSIVIFSKAAESTNSYWGRQEG